MKKEDIIVVGRVAKPDGVKGFIRPDIDEEYEKSLGKAPFVFIFIDGLPVPFKIQECRPERNHVFKIDKIDSPEDVAKFINLPLGLHVEHIMTKKKITASGLEKWVGYMIIHEDVEIGVIREVEKYPGQIMAILDGKQKQLIHIPMIEEWITKLDENKKLIYMDLPQGLLEIY